LSCSQEILSPYAEQLIVLDDSLVLVYEDGVFIKIYRDAFDFVKMCGHKYFNENLELFLKEPRLSCGNTDIEFADGVDVDISWFYPYYKFNNSLYGYQNLSGYYKGNKRMGEVLIEKGLIEHIKGLS